MIRILIVLFLLITTSAHATIDWTLQNQFNFEASPIAMVPASDGKTVYVLTPGKIVVYSVPENRVIDFMPVDRKFDHLTVLGKDKLFFLSSSKDNSVSVFERKKSLDFSGLSFKGPPEAPVTVAVFSDYQCPYCGRLEPLLQQVLEKYPNNVKLVFKNFPLSFHSQARKAATAALAAQGQGKFWEFHHKLFEAASLNDQKIQDIAKELKLDMNKFNEKLKDPAIQETINRDLADGKDNDVSGTPAIFVNGKEVNERSLEGFSRMIDAELRK
jgi:thiol-disulfide isomerase/thioredoxin